jgi:hypothetical protein
MRFNQCDAKRLEGYHEQMRETACRILASATYLTPHERQFLHDVKRPCGRSKFVGHTTMLALSARCADPSVRYLVPEISRGQIVATADGPPLCAIEAFRLEAEHQGRGNAAQLEYLNARTVCTAEAAIPAKLGHYEALRASIDALHVERAALLTRGRR